jgi:molybdopterin/thiamine biosynthesis adenylyltransferase
VAAYRGRDFTDGWRLKTDLPGHAREFDLLVRRELPFMPPSVALAHPPPLLTWPHVEEDGLLCLLSNLATASHSNAADVARALLVDAYELIKNGIAGNMQDDFLREFLSYWNRGIGGNTLPFLSLIDPRGPSRIVSFWAGKVMYVFGEDEISLRDWLGNRFGQNTQSFKTEHCALLWLDRPLYPNEYPKTARDVLAIARERSAEGAALLPKLAESSPDRIIVMLGTMTKNGPCLAGVTVHAPQLRSASGKLVSPLQKGFRPGMIPPSLVSDRYWRSDAPVRRSGVDRADAAWIHGRGQDSRQPLLSYSTVAVIGCGSIGAQIALLLAQAGVGKLILIDPDILKWANVGRHPLGAKHVGRPKALALTEELKGNYPHIKVEAKVSKWESVLRLEPELLASCSMIVSATGDWGSESALNEWQKSGPDTPAIIYGWTEPHACAGHAVAIKAQHGCFECGFDSVGAPRLRVTAWLKDMQAQEPACGSVYQPYGPMELNNTVTLVGELALDILLGVTEDSEHRIWACRHQFLITCSGNWTDEWLCLTGGRAEGGFTFQRPWSKAEDCAACSRKGVAA